MAYLATAGLSSVMPVHDRTTKSNGLVAQERSSRHAAGAPPVRLTLCVRSCTGMSLAAQLCVRSCYVMTLPRALTTMHAPHRQVKSGVVLPHTWLYRAAAVRLRRREHRSHI
jgi:hypothetical protein